MTQKLLSVNLKKDLVESAVKFKTKYNPSLSDIYKTSRKFKHLVHSNTKINSLLS